MKKTAQTVISADKYYTIAAVSETVIRTEKYRKKTGISAPFIEYCRRIALAESVEGAFSFRERETRRRKIKLRS